MTVGDSETRSLPIRGVGAGPVPLTWGQGNMWDSMAALGPASDRLNIFWTIPVRGSVRVSEALDRLASLLSSLDVFRATYDVESVRQVFRDEVRVEVRVTEAAADTLSGPLPTGSRKEPASAELANRAFGMDDPQIRFGLEHVGGSVRKIHLAMSHLAFDGGCFPPLNRLVADAVEGRGLSALGMQTGALVEYEQSDDQVRRSDAVIDGWLSTSAKLPPGRGLMAMTPGSFSVSVLRSSAAAVAVQSLAVRYGVSASGVVVSALTKVIRQHIHSDLSTLLVVCNNRSHPRLADFVGQTIGNGLLVLPSEHPGDRFVDYAKKTYTRTLATYSRARYDCLKWRTALTDLSRRGLATDLSYYFNDVRSDRDAWSGFENRVADLKALVEESSVETVRRRDLGDGTVFADFGGAGEQLTLQLVCDDALIPPSDARAALIAWENLLVTEALAA